MLMQVDSDELNTILSALRLYQSLGYGDPFKRPDWLHDIACPDPSSDTSLANEHIDDLCERLNCTLSGT